MKFKNKEFKETKIVTFGQALNAGLKKVNF